MGYVKGQLEIGETWYAHDIIAFLPHSCDEWEIGGVEEIDNLITDLQAAKARLTLLNNKEGTK